MKKTIQIHILGIQFTLEEEAYDLLKSYLERLQAVLASNPDHREIYKDVEARVAELASQKINDVKQVLEVSDVEEILKTLGNPEEFMDEENSAHTYSESTKEKKLFRDPKKASIAGVCAGLSAYFNIDVLIIRVLFVLFFFIGFGFVVPVYIILWVIIPPARSNSERLQMHGRPITLDNLREEFSQAGKNMKNSVKTGVINEGSQKVKHGLAFAFLIILKIFGVLSLIYAFTSLISVLLLFFLDLEFIPFNDGENLLTLNQVSDLFLVDSSNSMYLKTGILITQLCISLFFMVLGTSLIFKLKTRWMKPSLLFFLFVGILSSSVLVYQAIRVGVDFSQEGIYEQKQLTITDSILHIDALASSIIPAENHAHRNENTFLKIKNDSLYTHGIAFEYGISKDSSFHIYSRYTARGKSESQASKRAKHIHTNFNVLGNKIWFNPIYQFPIADKFRGQEVKMVILIPENGQIIFQNNIIRAADFKDEGFLNRRGIYDHEVYDSFY